MKGRKILLALEEEITILNDYAFIQQKRYGRALQINIKVTAEEGKNYYITPLAFTTAY